jgi:hypothetical protein
MKTKIITAFAAALMFLPAQGQDKSVVKAPEKIEKFTTKDGKEYIGVTITAVRPDGISIMHESGTARVSYQNIPDDLAEKLGGFDPELAKESRMAELRKIAATQAMLAREAAVKAEADAADKEFENARRGVATVKSVTEEGALCEIGWQMEKVVTDARDRKDAFGRSYTEKKKRKVTVLTQEDQWIFIRGMAGVVDGDEVGVAVVPEIETYAYDAVSGARKTVASYRLVGRSPD